MKKIYFYNTLFAIFIAYNTVASATAADTIVNFSGTIKASTCDIDLDSTEQTIPLGNIGTTSFGNPGDVSEPVPFFIALNCPVTGLNATVTFDGTNISDSGLLKLDSSIDAATGIAVRINEGDGITQVRLGEASAPSALVSGQNILHFTAQYQALTDRNQISAGIANATAQFFVNYP